MEILPYETIVAILAFWMAFVIAFVLLIRRMRTRHANDMLLESTSTSHHSSSSSSVHQADPKRIIQIYYIGNWDSSTSTDSSPDDILSKVLAQIEDHPPSYDEVSSSHDTTTSIDLSEDLTVTPTSHTQALRSGNLSRAPQQLNINSQSNAENGMILVVEQQRNRSGEMPQ